MQLFLSISICGNVVLSENHPHNTNPALIKYRGEVYQNENCAKQIVRQRIQQTEKYEVLNLVIRETQSNIEAIK